MALVDVNGDGTLDLIAGDSKSNGIGLQIYLNLGPGYFLYVPTLAPAAANSRITQISVGDIDRDGDVDIVALINFGPTPYHGPYIVLKNDGSGNFTPYVNGIVGVLPSGAFGITLEDMDGDGDLDCVFTSSIQTASGYAAFLGINDGSGRFVALTQIGINIIRKPIVADINGDNRPDVIVPAQITFAGVLPPVRIFLED